MDTSEFVLRIRHPGGMARINVPRSSTLLDLRNSIQNVTNIPATDQILRPESDKNTPITSDLRTKLSAISIFRDGLDLWIGSTKPIPAPGQITEVKSTLQERKGPITIAGTKPAESKAGPMTSIPSPGKKERMSKCNHGPGGRCLNCAPMQKTDGDNRTVEDLSSLCNHGPNGKCPNCVEKDELFTKHMSFERWMEERRSKCADHPPNAKCNNCLPPAAISYKMNLSCTNHLPFPKAMCNKCMPPSAIIKRQGYRHVDYAQFQNSKEMFSFVNYWTQTLQRQERRMGLVYGYYAEDPDYRSGVRAIVEAIYEPPQHGDISSAEFLADEHEFKIDALAQALGLERIGWIFTSIDPHSVLTSHEVRLTSRLQQVHIVEHETGYKVSKFITIVLRPNKTNNDEIAPDVYMVSDQAQALEKDEVFGEPTTRKEIPVREPLDSNDILPSLVVEGKPVKSVQPEFFVVNVAHGQPKDNKFAVIKHAEFPVENRMSPQKPGDIRTYLNKYKKEPSYQKFADFHLLVYIMKLIDIETACVVAQQVRDEKDIDPGMVDFIERYGQ
jgi:nuclear protein localization family protein 4